ncbi:ebs-bah-phd domain-containing protein [Metarhizium album ARSEF 1941]|uniref:Ebs-bah-phd domain-containing protein n=1 Tax=Metarhizium album (strain ARSEF 1941) TaxID=1081103 RepID=A0A0B2WLG4_METAS|nr:ebs-bah-phd domain-containing protein [Metarhizium album ARSEF 1941]KHN93860.1 ebs-bah-phd domain-containing protein [Metarhizium album ARSEF 1941]
MSSKSRRRSRAVTDENRADCPFTITMVTAPSAEDRDHIAKKRKRDAHEDGPAPNNHKRELVQMSPFEPRGKFRSNQSMNLAYTVEPRKRWQDMTRYNSFVLNGYKYCNDDFIYVANEATIERQKSTGKNADAGNLLQSNDYWVARILEVRAADEHHVYARIYWMYSPDELPPGTQDGKKTISGRQPYHGQNELIASNHMDVINVVSVAMKATVHQWIESDDEEVQDALYWRQAFNCRTSQVSSVDLTCKCQTPANPDKTLIGCTNADCGQWLHYECLLHDSLLRIYERLGTDKPHISDKAEKKLVKTEREMDEDVRGPLTPTESKMERTPPAIDVKGPSENGNHAAGGRTSESTPKGPTQTPTPGPPNSVGPRSAKSASAKKGRGKKAIQDKPYEGLFEASLKMNDGPMVWVISDLRANAGGGDRTWTERAQCLVCRRMID